MQVISTKITSKSEMHCLVSFTIQKAGQKHYVQARYIEHDVLIDSTTTELSRREEQVLADRARAEKERYEQSANQTAR